MTTATLDKRILLQNVRLAFPNLWQPRAAQDGGKAKYGASLILPHDHPAVKAIRALLPKVAKEKWGDKADVILKGLEKQDRICLHDGDVKAQYDGFAGNLFVSANSDGRPSVLDRDKTPLAATDGKPYSGCYVNVKVEFWGQEADGERGIPNRLNATILAVQFAKHGEPFGGGTRTNVDDEFDEEDGDYDDDDLGTGGSSSTADDDDDDL